jgi:hypothetical protein
VLIGDGDATQKLATVPLCSFAFKVSLPEAAGDPIIFFAMIIAILTAPNWVQCYSRDEN